LSTTRHTIRWLGDAPTETGSTLEYALLPAADLPPGSTLINTVHIDGGALPVTRTARVVVNPYQTWLPVVMR